MIYVRGDTHRQFAGVRAFCAWKETTKEDILIITGDAGINGADPERDLGLKRELAGLSVTLFCVHGNHDRRPSQLESYQAVTFCGGTVYMEEEFPNLLFAKSGEWYDLEGMKTMVIGGAASPDKQYRLDRGLPWWPDEQLSKEERAYVEMQLAKGGWQADLVLSHTVPKRYIPRECLERCGQMEKPDLSTERWLDRIEERLCYKKWFAGHWHVQRRIGDGMEIVYQNFREAADGADNRRLVCGIY